jgi:hypothetical protein
MAENLENVVNKSTLILLLSSELIVLLSFAIEERKRYPKETYGLEIPFFSFSTPFKIEFIKYGVLISEVTWSEVTKPE